MNKENKKHHINHKETNNKELGVTITKVISEIIEKPTKEIHLRQLLQPLWTKPNIQKPR